MPKRSKQLEFMGRRMKKPDVRFGGSLLGKSNPKYKRPLDSKRPIHLVLRAQRGGMRSPRAHVGVNRLVTTTARKYGVTIYEYANVGNHLHAVIRLKRIDRWAGFIRELTGRIARYVKERGVAEGALKFWKYRPYTRLITGWQEAFRTARQYVGLNRLEAEGHISRQETKTLKDLKKIWEDTASVATVSADSA